MVTPLNDQQSRAVIETNPEAGNGTITYSAATGVVFSMPGTSAGVTYLWTLDGVLPPSVAANPPDNLTPSPMLVLSGIPPIAGQFAIRMTVHSANHDLLVAGAPFTITVSGSSVVPPVIEPVAVTWFANALVQYTLSAAGGTTPYVSWSAEGLPPGISIDPQAGVLSGTTIESGVYDVLVGVTDAIGRVGSGTITLTVNPLTVSLFEGTWSGSVQEGASAGQRLSFVINELGESSAGTLGETVVATPEEPVIFSLSASGELNGIVPMASWHLVCRFIPPDLSCLGHSLTTAVPPVPVVLVRLNDVD